jgi:hypothetical protein
VQATTGYAAGRPARRNNVTYGDRPSKVTDAPCCHIEFRFKSTRICQKRDVRVCGDLLSYDPLKFIDRDMKLGLIDWKRAFQILRRLNPTKRPVLRQDIIAKTFEALTTPQHRPSFDDPPRFTQLALEVVPQWKDAMFSMSVTELLRACTRAQRACGVSDYNAPFPISTPKHLHHNKLFARSTSLSAPLSLNPYVIPTLPIKYDT